MESYPNRLQARLEQRNRTLRSAASAAGAPHGFAPHYIINLTKRWTPGQTLRVAFKGGSDSLHKDIEDSVNEWTQFANLTLDFKDSGNYRTWSPADTSYAAEIRVSFDQSGYYSLVGNDSINPAISKAGEESLNLEGFDRDPRPSDWKAVALHEFGHAIGFEHEHQAPLAPCDFRFDDEAGYVPTTDTFGQFTPDSAGRRPGLYTLLGGPPNNWPTAVVDHNLRQLPDSHAYETGPFDKSSIMKYFFPDWMFVSGEHSACFTPTENLDLSSGDKEGAAKVYPRAQEAIKAAAAVKLRIFKSLNEAEGLPAAAREQFKNELKKFDDKDH
jgi:hypothetical protein